MSSLIEKTRVVAAKAQAAAGTVETLADANANFYGYESEIRNQVAFTQRTAAGSLSQVSAQPGIESGTHTMKVDLYQNAPWVDTLMPAFGFAESTGNIWQPSDDPDDWDILTSGHNKGGKLYRLAEAMGQTLTFNFKAGEPTVCDVALLGRYTPEIDATALVPSFSAGAESSAPIVAGSTFTLAGNSVCWAAATLTIQNTVSLILCSNSPGGIDRAWIEERLITLTIDPLEELVTDRDDHGVQRNRTEQAIVFSYGNMSIAMPKAQLTTINPQARNGLSARALTFQGNKSSTAGDEIAIDFDTTDPE